MLRQSNRTAVKVPSIDLLSGHDWADFAGAKLTTKGVKVTPLNRRIVHQDGSGGQPNPPVNVAGPVLSFSGDFALDVGLRDFQTGDTLRLYRGTPIIYDEWRYEPSSLQLSSQKQSLEISVWNGTSSDPATRKSLKFADKSLNTLRLVRLDGKLEVIANGKKLGNIGGQPVFMAGKIWFGLSSAPGNSGWTLTHLSVTGPKGTISIRDGLSSRKSTVNGPTLQKLANARPRPLYVGTAVALNPLLSERNYRELALDQFGMWTPENELKPQFIHPQPSTYSFQEADLLINTALKNNIAIHGHTLVFGEANPRWMQNALPAKRKSIMTSHITNIMLHFKGRVREWDVINEPLSDNDTDYENGADGLRHHIWYQGMGKEYIPIALRAAHAADPGSKLYINDYGLEADGERWYALMRLVTQLRSQGVPLNGIGFEAHVYDSADHIEPAVLKRHIEQLAQLGLISRISEIDVHGENPRQQAFEYDGVLRACLEEPTCTAYSTWGITDRYGSTTDTNVYPLNYGDDLLWDTDFRPKVAYMKLTETLRARPD